MSKTGKLSLGNHIYLYRLLRDALGCGKQAFMPKVEEALEAEGMSAADLGFDATRDLLEELGDFVELTVFKGGRVYATVVAQPAWDEALAAPEKKGGAGGKSWKKKKGDKTLKAVKPQRVKREEPVVEVEAETAAEEPPVEAAAASEPATTDIAEAAEAVEAVAEDAAGAAVEAAEDSDAAAREGVSRSAVEPSEEDEGRPGISLTVVYDPDNANAGITTLELDPEREPQIASESPALEDDSSSEEGPVPASDPVADPDPAAEFDAPERPSAQALADYPHDFAAEVHCPGPQLSLLARMLPFGCDIMQLLTEDFRIARGMGSVVGKRAWAAFPLRYVHAEDNSPVLVGIRKSSGSGMAWAIEDVDGIDLDSGEPAIPELSLIDGGPWYAIDPERDTEGAYLLNPRSTFATLVQFEDPDAALEEMADFAAPEPWTYPEGVSLAQRLLVFDMLYDFLAIRFCRALDEGLLVAAGDEEPVFMATGLCTPKMEPIAAVFMPQDSDIPMRYIGCIVQDPLESYEPLAKIEPADASVFASGRTVVDDAGLDEEERALAQKALLFAACNHRVATSVYYPPLGRTLLAIPGSLEDGDAPTFIVDAEAGDDALHIRALITASCAYVLGRVVSDELPHWLVESFFAA